jgi:hypothetical protein
VPKPGPGNRAGFFIARTRGSPKTLVEALNTPVVGPVMCLFGERRDSLFLNRFK